MIGGVPQWEILIAVLAVAAIYASVGHGGASGYLAVLALTTLNKDQISSTALVLNLVVAGTAFIGFAQTHAFSWKLTWPFLLGSVPLAFVGGALKVSDRVYYLLLGVVLVAAAARLVFQLRKVATEPEPRPPHLGVAAGSGAGIGLLSGLVGVGGGIFLSPLIILAGWGGPRASAATSAIFIVANSSAGLLGRSSKDAISIEGLWPLIAVAWIGGLLGTYIGSRKLPVPALRGVLAGVLLLAATKMVLSHL